MSWLSCARGWRAVWWLGLVLVAVRASAADEGRDWPGWRGPARNGVSAGDDARPWLEQPQEQWRAAVGTGFSSLAVCGGRVYTLGNVDDVDSVVCLDAATGKEVWKHSYPCPLTPLSYEGGPSATPLVHSGRVYTLSKAGHVFCLDADNGRVVWSQKFPAAERQEGDYQVDWGYAASPLVLGEKLILGLGAAGMALRTSDGGKVWDNGPGRPGYASPVVLRLGDAECVALFTARGVVAVEAETGRQRWTIPWRTRWDQNAPDVLVHDGKLLVTSGHNVGCALFDLSQDPPREVWRNKALRSELSTPVLWQGNVCGFDNAKLTCIDWQTGDTRWTESGFGRGTLILVGQRLVVLGDHGKLAVAPASPQEFRPTIGMTLPGEGRYWTAPAWSAGQLLLRNAAGQVVCLRMQ